MLELEDVLQCMYQQNIYRVTPVHYLQRAEKQT